MRKPAVVVLLLALVAVLLSTGIGVGAGVLVGSGDDAREFSSPSYPRSADSLPTLIADVSESVPGPSIAVVETAGIFTDGYLVFGANSDRVRNVPEVADRLDPEFASASTQLSPDGRLLAIGDLTGSIGDVVVVDLTTGSSRHYADSGGVVEVLAWSPDGKRLAISWGGSLSVLDVQTGASKSIAVRSSGGTATTDLLPGESPVPDSGEAEPKAVDLVSGDRAAFSPDGRSIAYDDGVDIEVLSLDGSGSAPVLLTDKAVWLAGASAWSPDGKSVLVTRDETTDDDGSTSLLSIDVATRTATRVATFDYIEFSAPMPVGWRGPSEVLLAGVDEDSSLVVDAYGLDGKRRSQLMSFGYSAYSAQFAAGLLSSAVERDGGFSGGPTPTWWRVTIGVAAGVVAAVVFAIIGAAVGVPLMMRRRGARRTAPAFGSGFGSASGSAFASAGWPGAVPGAVPVAAWPPPVPPAGPATVQAPGVPPAAVLAGRPASAASAGPRVTGPVGLPPVPQGDGTAAAPGGTPGGGVVPPAEASTPGSPGAAEDARGGGAEWALPR